MKIKNSCLSIAIIIGLSTALNAKPKKETVIPISLPSKVIKDYGNFYTQERLIRLGIGFLSLGFVANSKIDGTIQTWYQDHIRSGNSDTLSKKAKLFGEGKYLIPFSLLSGAVSYIDTNSTLGQWGINATRAYIVGVPALLVMQKITGASRPVEDKSSKWRVFNDNNGVSGHAFVGAVPFLTLARMSENKVIKYASYTASGLAAWSRINDDAHYTSQILLGWYMAYEAVDSIFDTNAKEDQLSVTPLLGDHFYGITIQKKW